MYRVVTAKAFDRAIARLPVNWQKRIVAKIEEVAMNPYAPNNNLTKPQGRSGYRRRSGDWRVIYELEDERLVMLVLEVGLASAGTFGGRSLRARNGGSMIAAAVDGGS